MKKILQAMTIGMPPKVASGRSKYGLGLKTAAFWFGNKWKIYSKKLGETVEVQIQLDLEDIITKLTEYSNIVDPIEREKKMNNLISPTMIEKPSTEHYTRIEITDLNRRFTENVHNNTKENLRSIYRYDLMNGLLALRYNKEILTWNSEEFKSPPKQFWNTVLQRFRIRVNDKKVKGWAGVLKKGK